MITENTDKSHPHIIIKRSILKTISHKIKVFFLKLFRVKNVCCNCARLYLCDYECIYCNDNYNKFEPIWKHKKEIKLCQQKLK